MWVVFSFPRVQSSFLHTPYDGVYSDRKRVMHFAASPLLWMMSRLSLQGTGGVAMNREPTVIQIVDRILALDCGESCDVRLDPHITRVGNLEWLLPICVQ